MKESTSEDKIHDGRMGLGGGGITRFFLDSFENIGSMRIQVSQHAIRVLCS